MPRALVIQLARLGDLLQSFPVITALRSHNAQTPFDLLCPLPLTTLGTLFPEISQSLPWNGEDWHALSKQWNRGAAKAISQATQQLEYYEASQYSVAYNLNNHRRAVLAGHLLADRVAGLGSDGPLSSRLSPWAEYLRLVARYRGSNQVHLSDAFCGLCDVQPPAQVPLIQVADSELPRDLFNFGKNNYLSVGIVVGAGDADRRVSSGVWQEWITKFISKSPDGEVILIGGKGEQELAFAIQDKLSSIAACRVWNACGRTTLPQLAQLFSRCQWVVGSDTGPLHLGVACGARALGFYFSNARVHETGPYGEGHWVWQAEGQVEQNANSKVQDRKWKMENRREGVVPKKWPVEESVELLLTDTCSSVPEGWGLWNSHRDNYGAFYTKLGQPIIPSVIRKEVWQILAGSEEIKWSDIEDILQSSERPVWASTVS